MHTKQGDTSNGMIHVQRSFREFARVLNKFWLVGRFLDTMSNCINLWTIHVTANNFRPIRRWETSCILDSDWLKIVRCDMYRPKIDVVGHCIFNTLPPCYSRVLCASNQRQCIEQFVWKDAWYIQFQVRHNEKVGSTEGICFSEAFWQQWPMECGFRTFDQSLHSRLKCFKGIKYIRWYFPWCWTVFHRCFFHCLLGYDKKYIKYTHLWLTYVTRKFPIWLLDMYHSVGHVLPCIVCYDEWQNLQPAPHNY